MKFTESSIGSDQLLTVCLGRGSCLLLGPGVSVVEKRNVEMWMCWLPEWYVWEGGVVEWWNRGQIWVQQRNLFYPSVRTSYWIWTSFSVLSVERPAFRWGRSYRCSSASGGSNNSQFDRAWDGRAKGMSHYMHVPLHACPILFIYRKVNPEPTWVCVNSLPIFHTEGLTSK